MFGYEDLVSAKRTKPLSNAVQATATAGTSGSGTSLPFLHQVQRSFGAAYDLSGVTAHVDGQAAAAADRLGARAYATGNHIAFGEAPTLHTTAHEAAHVVQQRAGVHLAGPVGSVGDVYERTADRVADRVVRGQPAGDLLPSTGAGTTTVQRSALQRYEKVTGMPYDRLADDGKLAVIDHGLEGWAEASNIASSNAILARNHSKAKIEEVGSGDITVAPPGAAAGAKTTTLKKFHMIDAKSGGQLDLVDDCGDAAMKNLGFEHYGAEDYVAMNRRGTTLEYTGSEPYHGDDRAPGLPLSTTEVLSGQIYVRIFAREFKKTLSREDALKAWAKLPVWEQDRLSEKYGINEYAVPQVGQGITIGSERDMPGATPGGYNFHFAFGLLSSGHDYITLEDYDSSGVKYYLQMYGPEAKGQSFAEETVNAGAMGNLTTAMLVDHAGSLEGVVNRHHALLVDDPALFTNRRALAIGDLVTIQRKGRAWMKVVVKSGKHTGQVGWMLNIYFDPK